MKVELYTDMQSIIVDIKNKKFINFVKSHLDNGKEFDIFFPDYEIKVKK